MVVSALFALLAVAVALYGRKVEADSVQLTGASLVTLTSLLVPLVAVVLGHDAIVGERERNTLGLLLSLPVRRVEVIIAKFLGRLIALGFAVGFGIGVAMVAGPPAGRERLLSLLGPALLLGAAFLAIGVFISTLARRQISAASAAVALWFLLVLLYDFGLLSVLVISDGAVGNATIATAIIANPVGLFRLQMLAVFGGADALLNLGVVVPAPGSLAALLIWTAWIGLPIAGSALALTRLKSPTT